MEECEINGVKYSLVSTGEHYTDKHVCSGCVAQENDELCASLDDCCGGSTIHVWKRNENV